MPGVQHMLAPAIQQISTDQQLTTLSLKWSSPSFPPLCADLHGSFAVTWSTVTVPFCLPCCPRQISQTTARSLEEIMDKLREHGCLDGLGLSDPEESDEEPDWQPSDRRGGQCQRRGPTGMVYFLNELGEPLTQKGEPCRNCTAGRRCPYHNGCE